MTQDFDEVGENIQNGSEIEEPKEAEKPKRRPTSKGSEFGFDASFGRTRAESVSARLINVDDFNGKLLVATEDGEVYLVPSYEIKYTMAPQDIEISVIEAAERPYDWKEEAEALGVDPVKARVALARDGFIRKEDASAAKVKSRLTARGLLKPEVQRNG